MKKFAYRKVLAKLESILDECCRQPYKWNDYFIVCKLMDFVILEQMESIDELREYLVNNPDAFAKIVEKEDKLGKWLDECDDAIWYCNSVLASMRDYNDIRDIIGAAIKKYCYDRAIKILECFSEGDR